MFDIISPYLPNGIKNGQTKFAGVTELLHRMKAEQKLNHKVCGSVYCKDYLQYIYVDELGERIKPNYITQNFIPPKPGGM